MGLLRNPKCATPGQTGSLATAQTGSPNWLSLKVICFLNWFSVVLSPSGLAPSTALPLALLDRNSYSEQVQMLKLEPDFQQKNQLQFWHCVINPRKAG